MCSLVPKGGIACAILPAASERLQQWEQIVYSLYLDESGTHGGSPVFILAGIAVHEQDNYHLQQRMTQSLTRVPGDPRDFELHATEITSPNRRRDSPWRGVSYRRRMAVLRRAYRGLANYRCVDEANPCVMFGAVVERTFPDYEERAWEEVLHKFDELLTRRGRGLDQHERGIVLCDESIIERRVQNWADRWRTITGRIGVLTHMADVPFFADSRASRLLQAADLIAYALWRYYGVRRSDDSRIADLWDHFDSAEGQMHGLIHVRRRFREQPCDCPPCASRLAG